MSERKYERQHKGLEETWADVNLPNRRGNLADDLIRRLKDLNPGEILYTTVYRYRVKNETQNN